MKKITNFIIDKRYFILTIFTIFTVFCGCISSQVKINYDIAKYLPNTSETRIGMDIMEKEFGEVKTSTLNLMFKDLSSKEKEKIKNDLESIKGVETLDYDHSKNYNSGKYTLYVLTLSDKDNSKLAKNVYQKIVDKYEDYTIYTSGDVSEANKTVLPFWIIALAVFGALVILLVMCESYVEPFLFLTTILMAVILNKGTNIIFGTVSNITDSIAAILQMALSMDYSIMLMNRYTQEKEKEPDKIKAMKKALYKAFQAISSSSITTIVGLLALVFMSFTIGRDLGFVLAKGVLFSLLCIFFVLPALIILFDKWIIKTKKRTPNIHLNTLAKFSHKIRYISPFLFIIVFLISFMLKGNLGIDYTDQQEDKIADIFKENNQIAVIYKNKDEQKVIKYLDKLEQNKKVKQVLAYGNTINEKLTYNKLSEQLSDLGSNVEIEDDLLRLVYFDYYCPTGNKITMNEFVNFIRQDIYQNPKINKNIDSEMKSNIERLNNFTSKDLMNVEKTSTDIATILQMDKSTVDDLLTYYYSKDNHVQLTLDEFVRFMNKDVLTNQKYVQKISNQNKNQLVTATSFTNKQTITKKMTSSEMAKLFGLDLKMVDELYQYYILVNDSNLKLTIPEFTNFILTEVVTNSDYGSSFTPDQIEQLKLMNTFSNVDLITKNMTTQDLANLFGIDENLVKQVLLLKYSQKESTNSYTIEQFLTALQKINPSIDIATLKGKIEALGLDTTTPYTESELASALKQDPKTIFPIYAYLDLNSDVSNNWSATPDEFIYLILTNSDREEIKNNENINLDKLNLLSTIMKSSINHTEFTSQELAQVTGINLDSMKKLYTLYQSVKTNPTLTPQEFVQFILSHKQDSMLVNYISQDTTQKLNLINQVMNSSMANKKYNSYELSKLLGIDLERVNLLYSLYQTTYINHNATISVKELVNFLLNDVSKNDEYKDSISEDQLTKLNAINQIMNDSINGISYTSNQMYNHIRSLTNDIEKNMINLVYLYYGSNNQYNQTWEMTIENFVNFLNDDILSDERFEEFIDGDMKTNIIDAKKTIKEVKKMLVGKNYSRIVLNTTLQQESKKTFQFIKDMKKQLGMNLDDFYVIGNSPMAYEMSQTFQSELNFITILTMFAIFVVVAFTFKSVIIPSILVLIIQCAVYLTMGILSFTGDNVYFISLLIVQSILMGATIDYAILYTSYYLENRKKLDRKEAIKASYNQSIHTILTSSSILIIVTLVIANFASAIAAKICKTISAGTLCSTILILLLLPAVLACFDRFITRKRSK